MSVDNAPAAELSAAPIAEAAPAAVEAPAAVVETAASAAEGASPAPDLTPVEPAQEPSPQGAAEGGEASASVPEPGAEAAPAAEPEAEKSAAEGAEGDKTPQSFPTYEPFKLVEGLELSSEQSGALNNIMGKYGLSQEAAQEIVDFGSGILKSAQERLSQQSIDAFDDTRRGWVKDFEKMAGNRRNTMLNDAKSAIASALPDQKQRQDFWNVMALTGAGDHPAVIRLFANIGKGQRERGAVPATSSTQQPNLSPADRRYGRRS